MERARYPRTPLPATVDGVLDHKHLKDPCKRNPPVILLQFSSARKKCTPIRSALSIGSSGEMVSTGRGTTTNSINSLTALMPKMSQRQADATLVTLSEDPKTGKEISRWADGMNSDNLARSEIGRTVLKTGRHGEIFFNRHWLKCHISE
jgi:hypothetical protein